MLRGETSEYDLADIATAESTVSDVVHSVERMAENVFLDSVVLLVFRMIDIHYARVYFFFI